MSDYKPNLTEGQLKRQVGDYLEYGVNQGKWYADRLNSGSVLLKRGEKVYKVDLCREGTADFFVLTMFQSWLRIPRTIFLELKSGKGKQRPEQGAFQKLVEAQGAEYHLIRSIEELEQVLE